MARSAAVLIVALTLAGISQARADGVTYFFDDDSNRNVSIKNPVGEDSCSLDQLRSIAPDVVGMFEGRGANDLPGISYRDSNASFYAWTSCNQDGVRVQIYSGTSLLISF